MKAIKWILLIIFLNVLMLSFYNVKADSGADFGVQILNSNNTIKKEENYWNIIAKPKDQLALKLLISNYSNTSKEYNIDLNNATTNNNLSINYSRNNNRMTTNHNLSSLVTDGNHKIIQIPKYDKKIVAFHIKMPNNSYKGILMGGVTVKENYGMFSKNKGIVNRFIYSMAVLLRNNNLPLSPNLKSLHSNVYQNYYNNNQYVATDIENNKNSFINNLRTNTIIKNYNGKVVANSSTKFGTIAPISKFHLITPLKRSLPNGEYTVIGNARDLNNNVWSWTNTFEIKNNYLVQNDSKNNFHKKKNYYIIPIFTISFLILVIIFIFFLLKFIKVF